jgi:hypothetical protein
MVHSTSIRACWYDSRLGLVMRFRNIADRAPKRRHFASAKVREPETSFDGGSGSSFACPDGVPFLRNKLSGFDIYFGADPTFKQNRRRFNGWSNNACPDSNTDAEGLFYQVSTQLKL